MKYKTARALEMAVKEAARKSSRDTNRAIADFYNGRLIERIFSEDRPAFVLKGGRGMLARSIKARYTRDTDFAFRGEDIEEAASELKRIAAIDLDDFLEYRFVSAAPIVQDQECRDGYRMVFDIVLGGAKHMGEASLDLVAESIVHEDADVISPANRLEIDGLPVYDYLVYPVASSVADKVSATMQGYSSGRESSRIRDMVDIAVYLTTEWIDGAGLERELDIQRRARRAGTCDSFFVPQSWYSDLFENSFAKLATEACLHEDLRDLKTAEVLAKRCIDAAMKREVSGKQWNPESRSWV